MVRKSISKNTLKTFEKDYDNTISSSSLYLSIGLARPLKMSLPTPLKSLAKMVS